MRERKEKQQVRYPYFGLVGSVGVGKSHLANLLTQSFGAECFREYFEDNPYLKNFYTDDPRDFAFDSQMYFLSMKTLQMRKLPGVLAGGAAFHDPAKDVDTLIESVQRKMGWINNEQHEVYRRAERALLRGGFVPRPDVYIAIRASKETIIRRILERGREMEIVMHERFPRYFPMIVDEFEKWLKKMSAKGKTIVIDSDRYDYMKDERAREPVIEEVRQWSGYFIHREQQFSGRRLVRTQLIYPTFLIPRVRNFGDIPPGLLPEERVFRQR